MTQRRRFAEATAISRRSAPGPEPVDGVAESRFTAEVQPGWDVAGNPNGGYLLAIVARGLAAATARPDPISITGHFLRPARPGPVDLDVTVVRRGRRYATARAELGADRPLLLALGTFGDLAPAPGERSSATQVLGAAPVRLPDPDDCTPVPAGDLFPPPLMGQLELRLHPDDAGFLDGTPSGDAVVRGWFRLPDGEPVDTVALVCALDVFPPAVFNAALPVGWTPTIELTAHVRARPGPGWLACRFATRFVSGGALEVDGEIWDGPTLVAQSRQLALIPQTPG